MTDARLIVEEVAKSVQHSKIAILKIPDDIPWRQSMRRAVYDILQEQRNSNDYVMKEVDVEDNNKKSLTPGRFILDRYASSESVRCGYRERSDYTIQEYLKQESVLRKTIIWIKGVPKSDIESWLSFCKGFNYPMDDGNIIIELRYKGNIASTACVDVIDFDKHVNSFDIQLFNSLILDQKKNYTASWKRYISILAANLCKLDAELSMHFISDTDFKKVDPISAINNFAENPLFINRGREKYANHILSLCRQEKTNKIRRRVWSAQLQALFPIIELERLNIIQKYEDEISNALYFNNIEQYDESVKNAYDVEIGTLKYMFTHKNILYIPDDNIRNKIECLHKCRNKLAHMECCSLDEVKYLLSL